MTLQRNFKRNLQKNFSSKTFTDIPLKRNEDIFVPTPLFEAPFTKNLLFNRGTGVATFTRATTGTFVDVNTGLVTTAAIDAARFEQNGVLIEGASTNEFQRSEEFENVYWIKAATTISQNTTVSPDGTNTGDRLVEDTSTTIHGVTAGNVTTGLITITQSCFAKAAERTSIRMDFTDLTSGDASVDFDLIGGTTSNVTNGGSWTNTSGTITALTNGWFRCTMTSTQGAGTLVAGKIQLLLSGTTNYLGDGTSGAFIWGAQLEKLPFASSYIPTETAPVTRAADSLTVDAANIPGPTADYSVSLKVDVLGIQASLGSVAFDVTGESFRQLRAGQPAGGAPLLFHGANSGLDTISGSTYNANTPIKLAGTFDGVTFELFQNSVSQGTKSTFTAVTGTKSGLTIGGRGSEVLFGHIEDFKIFAAALNLAQVKTL